MPDTGVIPLQSGQGHRAAPTPQCVEQPQQSPAVPGAFLAGASLLSCRLRWGPSTSRPGLFLALLVVGRGVLPFLDHLVPLVQDLFQSCSLTKDTGELTGTYNRQSQALTQPLAEPWHSPKDAGPTLTLPLGAVTTHFSIKYYKFWVRDALCFLRKPSADPPCPPALHLTTTHNPPTNPLNPLSPRGPRNPPGALS